MTAAPPPSDPLSGWILEQFGYLETDHGFVSAWWPPAVLTFDLVGISQAFQVRVAANHEPAVLDVECRWPDEVYTSGGATAISLVDIVAMRAPDIEVPRDVSTAAAAEDTITQSARLLREYGWDAPYGALGMLFDFVVWKQESGTDGWWNQPPFDEGTERMRARTAEEIATDRAFQPIHELVHRDAEAAWSPILAFVERHAASIEASMLLEDLLDIDADGVVDRFEAEAQSNGPFRDTLESVYLGQISLPALDRLERLQEDIRGSTGSGVS